MDGGNALPDSKLNGVSAEMGLNVLAYNLKRVMKIIGTEGLLKAMAA